MHEFTLLAQAVREVAVAERRRVTRWETCLPCVTLDIPGLKLRLSRLDAAVTVLDALVAAEAAG